MYKLPQLTRYNNPLANRCPLEDQIVQMASVGLQVCKHKYIVKKCKSLSQCLTLWNIACNDRFISKLFSNFHLLCLNNNHGGLDPLSITKNKQLKILHIKSFSSNMWSYIASNTRT